MKYEIIKTDNYLLVVDESEITKSDWIYCPKEEAVTEENRIYQIELFDETRSSHVIKGTDGIWYSRSYGAKIIAHLPLNGSNILWGAALLPVLPQHQEDDVKELAKIYCQGVKKEIENHSQHIRIGILGGSEVGFIHGYNTAKEKYKYTEEDLRKAWNAAYIDAMSIDEETYKPLFFEDFIQSISQPNMLIGFECEMEDKIALDGHTIIGTEPKTTTTAEGHTQWVGTYIY